LKRLNLFAKGNLDVRDSLHSLRLGGEVRWNGINSLARERGLDATIRVRHEVSIGSEALAQADGTIPQAFAGRDLPLGAYTLEAQFGQAVYTAGADAYVLSIQPDIQMTPARHRRDGFLFQAQGRNDWQQADLDWLRADFEPAGLSEPEPALAAFEAVIERLRGAGAAPILVYNMSSVVPGETIHCHAGWEDLLSTRIRTFNLGLVELSQRTGISIIDVDRIVAEHGQRAMKLDTTHLTEQGCRAVAEEVLRVLGDYGCLSAAEHGQ